MQLGAFGPSKNRQLEPGPGRSAKSASHRLHVSNDLRVAVHGSREVPDDEPVLDGQAPTERLREPASLGARHAGHPSKT